MGICYTYVGTHTHNTRVVSRPSHNETNKPGSVNISRGRKSTSMHDKKRKIVEQLLRNIMHNSDCGLVINELLLYIERVSFEKKIIKIVDDERIICRNKLSWRIYVCILYIIRSVILI